MTSKPFSTLALCLLLGSALAEDASWISQRGVFAVSYQSDLEPLQINKLHAWIIHIEDATGEAVVGAQVEASGGMPVHNHGLPTRPRVTAEIGNGDYRLDGLRFHMAGEWEITISITVDGKTDTVVVDVML